MLKEYHLIVKGLVQGVGFRYFVQRLANRHHLLGYTKNLSDGTVAICLQGDPSIVQVFLEDLKKSPDPIKIEDILIEILAPKQNFKSFEILKR